MNLVPPQLARLTLCVCFAFVPATLPAQNQAAAPSQTPGAKPSPSAAPQKFTDQQVQEIISKLKSRIRNATDQVMGRIQREETDLYIKFSYFRKPDRLDPTTYASKDELAEWQRSLQQLREKEDTLEKLYADAEQDLGNALVQQQINQAIAEQLKKVLLQSFPWGTISKKNQLIREFIAEHGDLLEFYDKNWGSWKPGSQAGTATFDDQKLAAIYRNLKEKISATGLEIEAQYKTMLQ